MCGIIDMVQMDDPNGSIPVQPMYSRPIFGAMGRARGASCARFPSAAAMADGVGTTLGLQKQLYAVQNGRSIGKSVMRLNASAPQIEVKSDAHAVRGWGLAGL